MNRLKIILATFLFWNAAAIAQKRIVVATDGSGDFTSIQKAIDKIESGPVVTTIYIKKGIYNEKLFIEKPNIIFEGEGQDATVITYSVARDEFRCDHADDWGVATMNVRTTDITLKNLTITNSFGFDFTEEKTIACPLDSLNKEKKIRKDGHQMALRVMYGSRLKAVNCHFKSFGGDTVSPWDVESGYWYFKDCVMEGGVDFYCPRGWAWAENCIFICHGGSAAIWHDGSKNEDSKTVLVNCLFKGYKGFKLGRYHRDAQFYLLNCRFSENMADTPIYRVPTNNVIQWGHRVYYSNCHRMVGPEFSWYADNLPAGLRPSDITVNWLFKGKWNPENN
jgi:pectinesterase